MTVGSASDIAASDKRDTRKSPDFVEALVRGLAVLSVIGDAANQATCSQRRCQIHGTQSCPCTAFFVDAA